MTAMMKRETRSMHKGRTLRDREKRERGAAAITVAISLLVLMGFAALALDGGMGFDDRRGTQNSADNAALAAAWEACNPSNSPADPVGAALAVAAENGYDDTAADTSVTVTELSASEYEVNIQTSNDTTFARVGAGADTVRVTSRAVANCDEFPFAGGYALFAQSPSCGGVELNFTGGLRTVSGGVHSNDDMQFSGGSLTIDGPVTYGGNLNDPQGYAPQAEPLASPLDYPVDYDIADYRPSGSVGSSDPNYFSHGGQINNAWMISNGYATGTGGNITITQQGIYYTSSNIALNNASADPGVQVTFVAEGSIQISGSAGELTAYRDLLLVMSNHPGSPPSCSQVAVQFSMDSATWSGVIFAPNGQCRQNTAFSSSLDGSIICYTMSLNGSTFDISWQNNPSADPKFIVELTE
jgi:Flp pilus assembly protein TadG